MITNQQLRALAKYVIVAQAHQSTMDGMDAYIDIAMAFARAATPDVVLALLDELATWKHEAMHGGHADQLRAELAASKEANRVALEALEPYLYSEDGITMHEVREAITQLKEVLK